MRTKEEILTAAENLNRLAIRLERKGISHEADQLAFAHSALRWAVGEHDKLTAVFEECVREAALDRELHP